MKSLIKFELKSIIKTNGSYAVHGVYSPLPEGRDLANSQDEQFMLPVHQVKLTKSSASTSDAVPGTSRTEKIREGKESHMLSVVCKCLSETENWIISKTKKDYHFLGVFLTAVILHIRYNTAGTKL